MRHLNRSHRPPDSRVACPECGPLCKGVQNRSRPVLGIWRTADGADSLWCIRCGYRGSAREEKPTIVPLAPVCRPASKTTSEIANYLWQQSTPIQSTLAETYLRNHRGLTHGLPPTLRFLRPKRNHAAAMISAFGVVIEREPGRLIQPRQVKAVHLTRLASDGRKLDKLMLGNVSGQPIVLAPPNDALGLVIAEGIEDALSIHQVSSLGAWAAGSAAHMAKLAPVVPDYIDCVTLIEDDDVAGRTACGRLEAELSLRCISVRRARMSGGPYGT